MIAPPHTNAARCAMESLEAATYLQLWAMVPLTVGAEPKSELSARVFLK
jgi:hypothetical protein